MPRIVVTNDCHNAILKAAQFPIKPGIARRLPEGTWSIPLEQQTINRLRAVQVEGEKFSDTILRIITTSKPNGVQ